MNKPTICAECEFHTKTMQMSYEDVQFIGLDADVCSFGPTISYVTGKEIGPHIRCSFKNQGACIDFKAKEKETE